MTADVLYCVECGNSVLAAARFCNVCGAAQPVDGSGEGDTTGPTRSEPAGASTPPASPPASPAGVAPLLDPGNTAAGHAAVSTSAAGGQTQWTQPRTPPPQTVPSAPGTPSQPAPATPTMPDLHEAPPPASAERAPSAVRVCPDCGEVAGSHAFCASCGRNLSGVSRLPTRDEWESASVLRANIEAQEVASRLQRIETLIPMRPDSRLVDSVVSSQITRAIASVMGRELGTNPVSVELTSSDTQTGTLHAVAKIVLTNGALVEQRFTAGSHANSPARMQINVDGPSVLLSDGMRQDITLPKAPKRQPARSALSGADAAELAARRAYDLALEARYHGWKSLTIWYAFWAVLIGIGAITAFAHGQVGAGMIALVLLALCVKYIHYLYNGGRRRVWFIIW